MKVIVGLGNPGLKYEQTRHNIGFMVVQRIVAKNGLERPQRKFEGLISEWNSGAEKILLVMPQTYMNLSGACVRKIVDFYKITSDDLLVITDDIDLRFGQIRMRAMGSSGGQKGLLSVLQHLGTNEIARLRVGVGRPEGRMQAADYVLQNFDATEQVELQILIEEICDGIDIWIRDGAIAAMNALNQPRK